MRFAHPQPRSGFTLIEIIFAMLVVVVGLVGLVAVIISCQKLDDSSREMQIATKFAQQLMDDVRALAASDWDNIEVTHYPGELDGAGAAIAPCQIRSNLWTDVAGLQAPQGVNVPDTTNSQGYTPAPRGAADYQRGIAGACVETFQDGLKKITVEVRWYGASGNRKLILNGMVGEQQP